MFVATLDMNMEVASVKRSKLIMSFYRAAKPPATTVKPKPAASLLKTMSYDGYVHGPNGGTGDQLVDNKATTYISLVKERRRLEESNLI